MTAITQHALADDSDSDEYYALSTCPTNIRREHEEEHKHKLERGKKAKTMGLKYFLEMVDQQHRYGTNLRAYHQEWQRADTEESFFYWLDHGEGKNLDLKLLPRAALDKEKVRYLSREERQYYLVSIDKEGRLCWAKNGERINTTEEYRDSRQGIVRKNDLTPGVSPVREESQEQHSISPPSSPEPNAAARYSNEGLKKSPKQFFRASPGVIINHLMRKTVKKNTWIFVADTSFRLYIGIKQSGAFQHSSFLHGSRLSAAGLIQIEDGLLKTLSPLRYVSSWDIRAL